jgi:hypothetical protein
VTLGHSLGHTHKVTGNIRFVCFHLSFCHHRQLQILRYHHIAQKSKNVYHTIHPTPDPSSQTRPKTRRHLFHRKIQGLRRSGLYSRQAGPFQETGQAEDRMSRTVCFTTTSHLSSYQSLRTANVSTTAKVTLSHTWQQSPKAPHGRNPAISQCERTCTLPSLP